MRWAEVSLGFVSEITISETEEYGADWLESMVGGSWVLVRDGLQAGLGYTYDEALDAFIPPKPSNGEWVLDESTFSWVKVEDEAV
jgi:hypothetical protein